MRKFFSLIAAVLFAGSMMAAVGNLYYTFAPAKSTSNTGYANVYDVTISGMEWSVPGNQNQDGFVRIGGGKDTGLDGVERVITGKSTMGDAIAKIVLSHKGVSSDQVTLDKLTVVTASDADFSQNVVTTEVTPAALSKSTPGTIDVLPESDSWAKDSYYKIILTVSNTSKKNAGVDLEKIEFYSYLDASAPAIMASNIDLGLCLTKDGEYSETVELAVTGANLTDAITYTIDGYNTTVTGTLTKDGGTLQVTFSSEGATGDHENIIHLSSGTTTLDVTVTASVLQVSGLGEKDDPFSTADVVAIANRLPASEKYWVLGYIVGCAANGGALATEEVATNLALGDAADQTENLVPVELPSGDVRTALNIVDNPSNKGAQVKVYGQLISYFTFTGVKGVKEYELVGGVTPVEPTDTVQITLTSDVYLNDQTESKGWWLVDAYNDELEIVLSNAGSIDHVDGTYTAADLDPEYSYLLTETDSINFVSGSITLATSAEGVFTVIGTLVGTDNIAYEISLTKTPAAHIDMTFGFAEDADGITITPSLDTELWDYYIISASTFATTWGNDADALAEAYATQFGTQYAMTGAEDLVFADLLSYYEAGDYVLLAFGISDAGVTTDVATYAFTLSEAGEGIEEILATGKAVKVVRDGQVIVLKGNKAFNMNGQIVK